MPTPTIEELNERRRATGRLGGRPRNPTVAEAKQAKLEELVPKALTVLEQNLGSGDERVRQRAAETVLDRAWGKPSQELRAEVSTPGEELTELSDAELAARLRRKADDLRVKAAELEQRDTGTEPDRRRRPRELTETI